MTSQFPTATLTAALIHFEGMIDHCLEEAQRTKAGGRPLVGIMCEFTPRELLFAAGATPVCLCGGSADTVPAAEKVLPANVCPLIKSTFGYHLLRSNPFLEQADLVVAETTCDGKKKMFELMGATREMYILELPQKSDASNSLEHWVREVRNFHRFLEGRFNVSVTEDKLRAAIELMNRERRLRRELAFAMAADPPPFTGRQLLEFKSIISGLEADLMQYEALLDAIQELKTGMSGASGPNRKPRILLTGVPLVHGAEGILDLIESCDGVVVCMENCTGLKPILEDVDPAASDPLRAIAEKYFHLPCSVLTPNDRRMDSLRQLVGQFRPDCVIELVWQACLTYDIEAARTRALVENDLGLPYLKIVTDYAPADSARIRSRVEALLELTSAQRCQ